MADFDKPELTDDYTDVLQLEKDRATDLATMFKGSPTNIPTDAIRWSASASRLEVWDGTTWNKLTDNYKISVDKLNDIQADATATANKLLPLDANKRLPADIAGFSQRRIGMFQLASQPSLTSGVAINVPWSPVIIDDDFTHDDSTAPLSEKIVVAAAGTYRLDYACAISPLSSNHTFRWDVKPKKNDAALAPYAWSHAMGELIVAASSVSAGKSVLLELAADDEITIEVFYIGIGNSPVLSVAGTSCSLQRIA